MSGSIDVFYDERVLAHDTAGGNFDHSPSPLLAVQEGHPESADRVRNMKSMLERGPIAPHLRWHGGRLATVDELCTVHNRDYVERVRAEVLSGGGRADDDVSVISPDSWEPMLAAAGTALAAGAAVLDGDAQIAYALVRPPGHHAQPAQTDGYCFFNNTALVAQLARHRGAERVAILDWDVHHGNGTQECFWRRGDVLTASLHMRTGAWGDGHPQTGAPSELGFGPGRGFNINCELALGAGDAAYAAALEQVIAPILRSYQPEVIVCASGQDANAFDPNGRHNVTMAGFRRIGAIVAALADEHCAGRLIMVQEGGYAQSYSAFCLHATLEGVLGFEEPLLDEPMAFMPDDLRHAREIIEQMRSALSLRWSFD